MVAQPSGHRCSTEIFQVGKNGNTRGTRSTITRRYIHHIGVFVNQPSEGDLRLNSEMIPDSEFNKLCFIDKHLREKAGAFSNVEIGVDSLREATSMAFEAIILSRIVLPPNP